MSAPRERIQATAREGGAPENRDLPPSGSILLVRHGEGRGRIPDYGRETLRYISRYRPELSRRLRLHHTGDALPSLRGVRAVVFWLADPLEERYPECFAEASEIADRAARVVNPPEALSNSIKSRQAKLWREAGLPTPRSVAFGSREELEARLPDLPYPVVVRPDLLHTESRMHVCRDPDEVRALGDEQLVYPGTATRFVDVRAGYRTHLSHTLWADFYHKKRAFVVGGRVIPRHLFFSSRPFVRPGSSTWAAYDSIQGVLLDRVRDVPRWERRLKLAARTQRLLPLTRHARRSLRRELAFTESAPERPELFREAARVLGLGFLALDYSVRADGEVVLWEANPYPDATAWWKGLLPGRRRLRGRSERRHSAIAGFFEDLLRGDGPDGTRQVPRGGGERSSAGAG